MIPQIPPIIVPKTISTKVLQLKLSELDKKENIINASNEYINPIMNPFVNPFSLPRKTNVPTNILIIFISWLIGIINPSGIFINMIKSAKISTKTKVVTMA